MRVRSPPPALLTIRAAEPGEAETLLAIQREASLAGLGHIFPPEVAPYPDDAVRRRWAEALADPAIQVWVGEVGGEAVGSVSVGGDFFRTLHVLPRYWRSGVGSTLHDFAVGRLRARGLTGARLWALEGNDVARRFYEKRGWRLDGETRVVPFPPYPLDLGYSLDLVATSEADMSGV
jgi:GNAT superfamily N-acetyltransferase